jgi:hypothetical protein
MYHDVIKIEFTYYGEISFTYIFLISKKKYNDNFGHIAYGELMQKFEQIGFDLKYLKFNDISDTDSIVYCSYNYQENFNIFFKAYKKIITETKFNITFEYGNIVNGVFIQNNMNYFAGVVFTQQKGANEEIIKGKSLFKQIEYYQIADKNGHTIDNGFITADDNFETDFFQRYNVKVALRKFKLERLKNIFKD